MATSKRRRDSKGRTLKTGESQRKDGTYTFRWTDKNKTRQHISAQTLEELRRMEDDVQLDVIHGVTRDNITLNQLIQKYLQTKASLSGSTAGNYRYYFNHSIREDPIGDKRIIDLRKSDFLLFYKRRSEEQDLSNGTIHILHKIIHPALQLAVDDEIIRKNPSDGCMTEYPVDEEVKYALTPEQEDEFLERILLRPRIKRYYPMYAIMLYTGLRIGEIAGLTWSDVDMGERTINVNHQMQYRRINGETKLYCIDESKDKNKGRTKTKSGERIIPMTQKVYELFLMQRKEWLRMDNKDANFEVDGYRDFVFLSNRTGRNIYATNIRRMLSSIVEMNSARDVQLPHISPHILRHTACTRLAESGLDIKMVQYLMGHSDVKTTVKVYNHVDVGRAKREMEKFEKWQNLRTNFRTNLS